MDLQLDRLAVRSVHVREVATLHLGFRVWSLGLGFGFWVLGFGFWVLGFGFMVQGFGLEVSGSGLRVWTRVTVAQRPRQP